MSRGHLYWILSNPIYVGRLRHKGQIHDGLHPAIVDVEIWDRVQQRLASQTQTRRTPQPDDHSFLVGKLYDDRGNRMGASPCVQGRAALAILWRSNRMSARSPFAAPSTRECPPTPVWSRASTLSTTSARPRRPTSKVKPMRDGWKLVRELDELLFDPAQTIRDSSRGARLRRGALLRRRGFRLRRARTERLMST